MITVQWCLGFWKEHTPCWAVRPSAALLACTRCIGASCSNSVCCTLLQAAYAAYSAIATQAATVVGAMDKVWSGNGHEENGSADTLSGAANAQQQQARLALALQCSEDGNEVYVQVGSHTNLPAHSVVGGNVMRCAGVTPSTTSTMKQAIVQPVGKSSALLCPAC